MSETLQWILLFVVPIPGSILVGFLWRRRGRSFWLGFLLTYFATPIIGLTVGLAITNKRKEQKERAAKSRADAARAQRLAAEKEEQEQRRRQALELEQRALLARLNQLGDQATSTAQDLREVVRRAEAALDKVMHEYVEHMYHPFWDAVLKTVGIIDSYDVDIRKIDTLIKECKSIVGKLDTPPASLPIDLGVLPSIADVNEQLRVITRLAHSDKDFAQIYGTWGTNRILVRGFANVVDAVDGMGRLVASSIDSMASTVMNELSSIDTTLRDGLGGVKTSVVELQRLTGDNPVRARMLRESAETVKDKIVSIERELKRR